MAGFDKRDVADTQARETLIRRIDEDGMARFDDQRRSRLQKM